MNLAENQICPHCGAPAVDITTQKDSEKRWLCIGSGAHEWLENDVFDEPDEVQSSLVQRLLKKLWL